MIRNYTKLKYNLFSFRFCFSNDNKNSINKFEPNLNENKNKNINNEQKRNNLVYKNKISIFCFGSGFVSLILQLPIYVYIPLFAIGSIDLLRKQHLYLRILKVYDDYNGKNDKRIENLDSILLGKLIEDPILKEIIYPNSLSFVQKIFYRKSGYERLKKFYKPEDSYEVMQKKYTYMLTIIDYTSGLFGKIICDCVYNHDKDFYFRSIKVELIKPKSLKIDLLDNENTIDLK